MKNKLTKSGIIVLIDWTRASAIGYQGFDGEKVWPEIGLSTIFLNEGLASIKQLNDIKKYHSGLKTSRLILVDLLYTENQLLNTDRKYKLLGFDYGNYISEYNYYSLLLHEVVLGSKPEFQVYQKYLNKNKLFDLLDPISSLVETKNKMRSRGVSIEEEVSGEEFQPIAIYSID